MNIQSRPRTYILERLLEHGPLGYRELVEITGWPREKVSKTLYDLSLRKPSAVIHEGENALNYTYRLAD